VRLREAEGGAPDDEEEQRRNHQEPDTPGHLAIVTSSFVRENS
jgi:hypothetical protein